MADETAELRAAVERIKVQRDHETTRRGELQGVIESAIEALEGGHKRAAVLAILKSATEDAALA